MDRNKSSRSNFAFTVLFLLILVVTLATLEPIRIPAQAATQRPATTQPTTTQPTTAPVTTAPARFRNFAQAIEWARRLQKPIYLEFTAEWCTFCRKFEKEVLNTPAGRQILRKVIYLQLDLDANRALSEKFDIPGIPAGLLLQPEDNRLRLIDKHIGALTLAELSEFLAGEKN